MKICDSWSINICYTEKSSWKKCRIFLRSKYWSKIRIEYVFHLNSGKKYTKMKIFWRSPLIFKLHSIFMINKCSIYILMPLIWCLDWLWNKCINRFEKKILYSFEFRECTYSSTVQPQRRSGKIILCIGIPSYIMMCLADQWRNINIFRVMQKNGTRVISNVNNWSLVNILFRGMSPYVGCIFRFDLRIQINNFSMLWLWSL